MSSQKPREANVSREREGGGQTLVNSVERPSNMRTGKWPMGVTVWRSVVTLTRLLLVDGSESLSGMDL